MVCVILVVDSVITRALRYVGLRWFIYSHRTKLHWHTEVTDRFLDELHTIIVPADVLFSHDNHN